MAGYANGTLYACRPGTPLTSGVIATINLDDLSVTPVFDFDNNRYGFSGLAFNPDDGLFYVTQNVLSASEPQGLYSIDVLGDGAINFVTSFPTTRFPVLDSGEVVGDVDGLAIGNGIAYLVEEVRGLNADGRTIHPYDIAAGVYLPSITTPYHHPIHI